MGGQTLSVRSRGGHRCKDCSFRWNQRHSRITPCCCCYVGRRVDHKCEASHCWIAASVGSSLIHISCCWSDDLRSPDPGVSDWSFVLGVCGPTDNDEKSGMLTHCSQHDVDFSMAGGYTAFAVWPRRVAFRELMQRIAAVALRKILYAWKWQELASRVTLPNNLSDLLFLWTVTICLFQLSFSCSGSSLGEPLEGANGESSKECLRKHIDGEGHSL